MKKKAHSYTRISYMVMLSYDYVQQLYNRINSPATNMPKTVRRNIFLLSLPCSSTIFKAYVCHLTLEWFRSQDLSLQRKIV
jgi:TRAP-type C4-dicarboxylate transport system permease small subunit